MDHADRPKKISPSTPLVPDKFSRIAIEWAGSRVASTIRVTSFPELTTRSPRIARQTSERWRDRIQCFSPDCLNRNQNFILLWKFNWFENRLDAYYVKYKYIHNIENFFFLLIQKIIRVIAVQKKKKEKELIERNIEKYWSMREFDNLYTFKIDK